MRDVLIGHIDGPMKFKPRDRANAGSVVRALLTRGWLHADNPNRPGHTFITAAGRRELCKALANWADALIYARAIADGELMPQRRVSRTVKEAKMHAKLFGQQPGFHQVVDRLLTRLRVPSSDDEEEKPCGTTP